MNCPACVTTDLERRDGPIGPAIHCCPKCIGRWLVFDDHLQWLESLPPSSHATSANISSVHLAGVTVITEAPHKARLCPRCGKIISRYRFSPDHHCWLERCGSCAGIWFDRGEFEAVAAIVPLARIQHLFNDTHQHKVSSELAHRQHEQRCRAIVGDEAFDKAREFKAWIEQQPRRDVLMAYIDDSFERNDTQ